MNSLSGRRFMVKKNSQTIHQSKIFLLGMTGDIPGVIALINYSGLMSEYDLRKREYDKISHHTEEQEEDECQSNEEGVEEDQKESVLDYIAGGEGKVHIKNGIKNYNVNAIYHLSDIPSQVIN
ncbi:uncharacterized protein EV154DRAFT_561985 [Mucor mucedo]|uniref:uncharacterized protein n=1 Tax=Mucor mucedo TaxID=29922 RepID=UPI0022203955|nr:uncharacterized protein EV154DRAFT_561985 [Mucor mucedo]KAI7892693.1 hypothetical protein EV154DRAFT_561985 [Mucor mucedo]